MGASFSKVPVQGKRPLLMLSLSRLNQTTPKDTSGEEVDVERMIAEGSTQVALMARDAEIAPEEDPEVTSKHFIQQGNWHECKVPHYMTNSTALGNSCYVGQ